MPKVTTIKKTTRIPSADKIKEEIKARKEGQENNPVEQETEPADLLNEPDRDENETADPALISSLWNEYKAQLKAEEKSTELAILNQPYEVNESTITLQLGSVLQEDILERFRVGLLTFLREKSGCAQIKLMTKMVQEQQVKKLYTSQDKLDYLIKKNPAIKDFQRRLGLDIDF